MSASKRAGTFSYPAEPRFVVIPAFDADALYRTPADGFAELADTYDARFGGSPLLLLETAATRAALPDLAGRRVVDVGCGTGRYALEVARQGAAQVVGIDLVPEMLAVARRKARQAELPVQWRVGDLTDTLPGDDQEFDIALCALVLSFVPDLRTAFAEMARLLRPGGRLLVSDYHPHGLCAARAASTVAGRRDQAPYLRFTSAAGEEWRIRQTPHTVSDWFDAAARAGLILEGIAEPRADRQLANTYASLRDQVDIPQALILRFRHSGKASLA